MNFVVALLAIRNAQRTRMRTQVPMALILRHYDCECIKNRQILPGMFSTVVHSFPLAFSMRAHQTPHTHFGANALFELNGIVLHNSLSALFAQKVMPFIFKSHTVFVRLSFIRLASSRRSFVWCNLRSTITY